MRQQTGNSSSEAFEPPRDFVQGLAWLADHRGDDLALTVLGLEREDRREKNFTYAQLQEAVLALAAALQAQVAPGERALLLLDNDEHYVVSMFACFAAGVIAVPVFPPESNRPQHLSRLVGIASDARARVILTTSQFSELVHEVAGQLKADGILLVDQVDAGLARAWKARQPVLSDVAFLQYTSGSTSAPKGVMVTHACLMANEAAIREGLSITSQDRFGVWSPLFHDMGLIGGLLQPFYSGIPCVLCSPRYFTGSPVRWLQLIARHRVTISGGPDFAYRLCLDRVKPEQCEGLDLSCWRVAYTGAEPVRHDTMREFVERFGTIGFSAEAVYPCYGLAEATLFITGVQRGSGLTTRGFSTQALAQRQVEPQDDGTILVGCGAAASGHRVRIVDPESRLPESERVIGEIWASGPSIAAGYWQNPEQSGKTFVDDADGQRWLRTGDLGFMYQGHLYVSGRLKDMIIVRGHNLYPHDIEQLVENEIEAVRKGRVAAFAVEIDGLEGVGIAAEVSRSMQKLAAPHKLAELIAEVAGPHIGEAPKVIALLNGGGMPKTSSGKLQRQACRLQWREKALDAYALFEMGVAVPLGGESGRRTGTLADAALNTASAGDDGRPEDEISQRLALLWSGVLASGRQGAYSRQSHFFVAGGNSLTAAELATQVSGEYGIHFLPRHVFMHPNLGAMADFIRTQRHSAEAAPVHIEELDAGRRASAQPLSPAQLRQWFLWQLDPESTAYHVQGALQIDGELSRDALQKAVDQLVRRHGALRTRFLVQPDGEVRQVQQDAVLPSLQYHDLGAPDAAQQADIIRKLQQPFDLILGPLARAALLRESGRRHTLVLVMHHIIADAASMQVLLDELGAFYAAQLGQHPAPDALPLQYVDYAVWQSENAGQAAPPEQLQYWTQKLGAEHPVLNLPYDAARRDATDRPAAHYGVDLPAALSEPLRALAEKHAATPFVILLSAFQALLYRYTGLERIRIGVPVANRNYPGLDRVVGFFVNTLVLQQLVRPNSALADLIEQTRLSNQEAQANSDFPFEQLVKALRPERSAGVNPLFQVVFNYLQEDFDGFTRHSGLSARTLPLEPGQAQFELSLEAREQADGAVRLHFTYDSQLFGAATIQRMARHYLAILRVMAEGERQSIAAVPLLDAAEHFEQQSWGGNPVRREECPPVHVLFAQHAEASPQAPALIFGGQSLSYGELNARSNRLAHYLIAQGVGPESRVGIAAERSVEMIVGMLGVLKAGGAYVPLDPEYPQDRLSYMMRDSGICLLLTQAHLKERLAQVDGTAVIDLDGADTRGMPEENPQVPVHGEHVAYVIYTSGSTGMPKGVAVRHRALASCMRWMQETYRLTGEDRVLHKAPFGFDVSCWEIFWPLSCGVGLVVANPGDHRDPQRIFELIERHGVTTLNFVPAMLQAFLEQSEAHSPPRLKHVMCGGEAISSQVQSLAVRRLGPGVLQNLYGPTETTIHVTRWTCRDDGLTPVPIGRPIDETQAYVLDESLNLVPRGVAGELYIGGELLARGYLNRPDMTSERFVADPFGGNGGRLYRTGDLVRWSAEGQLEYLGRIDHQVKVRGFRIELGEIESQLLGQPGVREAVVVARQTELGARLAAYVSPHPGQSVAAESLRLRLSEQLPHYMVPSAIVALDTLPLNANGKVDRKALPDPEFGGAGQYEAPQDEFEAQLAQVWAEVLGVARPSRQASFFELGGHSLLLVRLHQLMRERLGVELSVVDLFKYPSIHAQAAYLRNAGGAAEADGHSADARAERRKQALMRRKRAG